MHLNHQTHILKVQFVSCDKCASQSTALSQGIEECPLSVTSKDVQTELPSNSGMQKKKKKKNSGMHRKGSLHNAVSF